MLTSGQLDFGTFGAKSGKFEIVSDDFEYRRFVQLIFELIKGCDRSVVHPVAVQTADVVVLLDIPIKTFEGTAKLKLLDFSQFAQHF